MTGGLCKTTLMSESARAKRCRQHVTQTGHYEQQCKTSWKKSLHLPQVKPIITCSIQSANLSAYSDPIFEGLEKCSYPLKFSFVFSLSKEIINRSEVSG
jgi:hypothetical protein